MHFRPASLPRALRFSIAVGTIAAVIGPAATAGASPRITVQGDASLDGEPGETTTVRLDQPTGQASVIYAYADAPLDLSAYRDAVVHVTNHATTELDLTLNVQSDTAVTWRGNAQGRFFARPGEDYAMHVFMPRPALPRDHPHVQRAGNLYAFPWGHQRHWQHPQADAIRRVVVRLAWTGAAAGQLVECTAPRGAGSFSTAPELLEALPPPWVDDFGQGTLGDWPGKITTAAELAADATRDRALIAANPGPHPALNQYGGLRDGPTYEATGFFRVEKIDGTWWFIDPAGQLFWSHGVNTTGNASETILTGREEYFPASRRAEAEVRFYNDNLRLKNGPDTWLDQHVDLTVARLHDWGLNTVGAWSIPEMTTTRRVPYTLIVHTNMQGIGKVDKIPDPFSPDFQNSVDRLVSRHAATHAGSPWLLGIFIDNELKWGGDASLIEELLKVARPTPARRALIAFLRERYPDLAALNAAWDADFASFDAVAALPPGQRPAAYDTDKRDFMTVFADTYFRVCREAMDRHFPNHLYLGCRFNNFNPLVNDAASRFCDVISANLYRHQIADFRMDTVIDRPLIIGEFHFGMTDYGVWGRGLTSAADARNQADLYRAYLSDALRHPKFIGAHWFQWSDQIVTGRRDGENFGVGLVSVVDRPNPTLTDALRDVSAALYDYRRTTPPTRIGAP